MTKDERMDLPRTPYPMLNKTCERAGSFSREDDSLQEAERKKRKITGDRKNLNTPPYLASFPSLESRNPSTSRHPVVLPVELMRAWESILDQIDWSEVVRETGWRRKPNTYRDVFKTIVHSHVEELKRKEQKRNMSIERGDEGTDTDSESDSTVDTGGDGFRDFEDETPLESDESGYGSEDYTDNGTEDDEDSDDKDQEDDESDVIDS